MAEQLNGLLSAPEGSPGVAGACLIYHRTLRDTFTACFSNTRREISSPVSTFVSVRLCRLSSLHFNFYTFLKSESMQQTQRLPIFYFLLVKICHLHYWRCSLFLDTISVNSHVLLFCSIVHTSYSTRRVSEAERHASTMGEQVTEFNGFVDFLF